jgi:exonuclease SbcD
VAQEQRRGAVIRLLHTSDSHFDQSKRFSDVIAMHEKIVALARAREVNLVLHGGDFFERRSTAAERAALADWLQAITEVAPLYGVKGNHDQAGDLEIFNRLRTRHPLRIEERATLPGAAPIWNLAGGDRVGLLGLAWVNKAHLVAGLPATSDITETQRLTIEAMRQLLTCLRAEASRIRSEGATPLFVSHAMIGGSIASSGQPLIGQTVEVSPADIADIGAAYAALGHIHLHQSWLGGRVAYSGNSTRHDHGEVQDPKGVRIVEIHNGQIVSSEFVELPARRIVHIEAGRRDGVLVVDDTYVEPGDLVRLRYHVPAEELHTVDEDQIRSALLARGAHEVKLEAIVEQSARVRSELIVEAKDSFQKIEAWLAAKEIEIDDAARERIRVKLAAIEAEQTREVAA